MMNHVEIVKKMNSIIESKDMNAYREILHPNYTFKGPMMTMNSRDEAVEFMSSCPFKFRHENCIFVSEGNTVVHMFDWVVEAPMQGRFRMAESVVIEGDKIRSVEMFFDTAIFPKEMMEEMMSKKTMAKV